MLNLLVQFVKILLLVVTVFFCSCSPKIIGEYNDPYQELKLNPDSTYSYSYAFHYSIHNSTGQWEHKVVNSKDIVVLNSDYDINQIPVKVKEEIRVAYNYNNSFNFQHVDYESY
jgi:hypothetical protein